jgi:hypothetical protein
MARPSPNERKKIDANRAAKAKIKRCPSIATGAWRCARNLPHIRAWVPVAGRFGAPHSVHPRKIFGGGVGICAR